MRLGLENVFECEIQGSKDPGIKLGLMVFVSSRKTNSAQALKEIEVSVRVRVTIMVRVTIRVKVRLMIEITVQASY